MWARTIAALVVASVCLWAMPAPAVVVFSETFPGPGLPATLTYGANPHIAWSVNGSGQLFADFDGDPAGATVSALTTTGFVAPTGLTTIYSLDLGIPSGASAGNYNIGMTFGGYTALFHPGYSGLPGAFRIEGGFSAPNMSMGFTPQMGTLHHMEVATVALPGGLAVDVTITGLGTDSLVHTFNYSFFDTTPNLDTGIFGARRSGPGNALSDGLFDNFQVQYVPEPSSVGLLGSGALAALVFWRRRRYAWVRPPGPTPRADRPRP